MKSIQYTIRLTDPKLDNTLRKQAKKKGTSFNEYIIDTLKRGSGYTDTPEFDDLDWFIGKKQLGREYDDAVSWLDSAPKSIK